MIKEIKYKGFTATPSDYECPDGELDAAINLVPEDGKLTPIQGGSVIDTLGTGEEVIFVHVVNDGTKHLIIKDGTSLYYRVFGESENTLIKTYDADTFKCSATGNVLCVYGIGEIEHFLFLHGEYHPLSTGDYAIGVLFGIDDTLVSKSVNINGIFTDANGVSIATWSRVATQEYSRSGTSGVNIYTSLTAGQTYKFHLGATNSPTGLYIGLTLYDSNGNWEAKPGGGNYSHSVSDIEFVPSFNVVRVYVAFMTSSVTPFRSEVRGTLTLDHLESVILPSGTYMYNPAESVNNALLGVANGLLADIRNANRFALPFFVRYGFRMIGGDIITVSPPLLIEPNTGVAPMIEVNNVSPQNNNVYYDAQITAKAYSCKLRYRIKDVEKLLSLLEIDEIIDSLVIGVSEPTYLYKEGATQTEISNSVYVTSSLPDNKCYAIGGIKDMSDSTATAFLTLPHYTDSYESRLASTTASGFKIIKEIKGSEISLSADFVDVPLDDGIIAGLSGITGSERMIPDNVENLSTFDAKYVMSYNQREHMLGVFDCMSKGFDLDVMCGYIQGTEHGTNYKVGCRLRESDDLQYLIRGKKQESSLNRRWFYYPSDKAEEAVIYENGTYATMQLFKHPFLKGAYRLNETAPSASQDSSGGVDEQIQLISEYNPNKVYVSLQGNPLVIEQRIRVGDGILLAAASNTKPISRGQMGQAPLFAFSSDGVWALEINSDGKYYARQAASRDVCRNIESITPIDRAVLFVTDRGVMALASADEDSVCISDAISSKEIFSVSDLPRLDNLSNDTVTVAGGIVPFMEFLSDARMLYDYTHQRIIVYNPEKDYAYVYSLKSKQWGMMRSNIKYTINSYPDCLAVDANNKIINLSSTAQDAQAEASNGYPQDNTVNALLITRPLKLDAPDILKTVDTIIQRGKFRKGHVKSILYGSRDLYNWHLVYSSNDHYLRGFRGTPYKYFRIVLLCELQEDESIFGCTVQFTPRLIDQPR
ncbi:MAG: hypothetical protein IJR86_02530 [Bacteroidaceae bacterium]|nr:hypothetical protein [Bacteroidaceae bacterium]